VDFSRYIGLFSLRVRENNFGCWGSFSPTEYFDIIDCTIGIHDAANDDNSITLFPNPSTNQFTVYSEKFVIGHIEVLDLPGKVVLRQQQTTNNKMQTVDVSTLQPGIYFVQIQSTDKIITRKLAVSR
jgi:hypothetical protein